MKTINNTLLILSRQTIYNPLLIMSTINRILLTNYVNLTQYINPLLIMSTQTIYFINFVKTNNI